MIKLYVDDERNPPSNEWILIKNHRDTIQFLIDNEGKIDTLSLDHDLGIGASGYHIAKWIEEKVYKENYIPPKHLYCHSQNPVGKENIKNCYRSIKRKIREI